MDKINFYHCERLKRSIFLMDFFQIHFFLPKIKVLNYSPSFLIPECVADVADESMTKQICTITQYNKL